MTALSNEKMSQTERWGSHLFPLAVGNKGWKNGIAALDLSTGKVEPGHIESDLFVIGRFAETIDATSAEKQIQVNLGREIEIEWFANGGTGSACVAADVGNLCYVDDDQTVTITASGRSVAGRIWAISATQGVAVERLSTTRAPSLPVLVTPAFVANDLVIAASPTSGAVADIPATAANSTVTLPAAAREGTRISFFADGIKNGHTVQYRDATGPVNLTTALLASKRHLVICQFLGGKWAANAYTAP